MGKLITYGNCLLYLWVSFSMSNGVVEVYSGTFWQSEMSSLRMPFLIFLGAAVLYTIVCGLGLLMKKEWSIKMALPWNIALGFIVGVIPVASVVYVAVIETAQVTFNIETLLGILVGLALFILAFGLRSEAVKKYFGSQSE